MSIRDIWGSMGAGASSQGAGDIPRKNETSPAPDPHLITELDALRKENDRVHALRGSLLHPPEVIEYFQKLRREAEAVQEKASRDRKRMREQLLELQLQNKELERYAAIGCKEEKAAKDLRAQLARAKFDAAKEKEYQEAQVSELARQLEGAELASSDVESARRQLQDERTKLLAAAQDERGTLLKQMETEKEHLSAELMASRWVSGVFRQSGLVAWRA
ncbi:hypothetical protein CYMTET_8851, partial [Cymbomonas tetramitiformis]